MVVAIAVYGLTRDLVWTIVCGVIVTSVAAKVMKIEIHTTDDDTIKESRKLKLMKPVINFNVIRGAFERYMSDYRRKHRIRRNNRRYSRDGCQCGPYLHIFRSCRHGILHIRRGACFSDHFRNCCGRASCGLCCASHGFHGYNNFERTYYEIS